MRNGQDISANQQSQILLETAGSEKELSDTGLIEVIGRCYRQAKQSGNTAMVNIAVRELNRRIEIIDSQN